MMAYLVIVNLQKHSYWQKYMMLDVISDLGSRAYDHMSCLHYSTNLCNKTKPEFTISVLNTPLYCRLDPHYLLTASGFMLLIS